MTLHLTLAALAGALGTTGLVLLAAHLAGLHPPATTSDRRTRRQTGRRTGRRTGGRTRSAWTPATRRRALTAAAAGVLALAGTGWLGAGVAAAGAVILIPGLWSDTRPAHVIVKLEALAAWTRRLSDLMASGAASSLDAALARSLNLAPEAIRPEVHRLARRIGPHGPETALRAFAADLRDPAADHVVLALILRARAGGKGLALVLRELADDIEAQVRMRRDVEADRGKARANVRLILGVSVAVWLFMATFARDFMSPFSEPIGQLALLLIVALFGGALVWMRTLTRAVVGPRLLTDPDSPTAPAAPTAAATAPAPATAGGAAARRRGPR